MTTDLEARLRDLIHSTGELIQQPFDLVERGVERGRRVRRHRRLRSLTAGALAVLALMAGTSAVVRASGTSSRDAAFDGRTVSGVSTPTELSPQLGEPTVAIDGRSAAVILLSLLPAGTAWNHGGQEAPAIPPSAIPDVYAYTTYDDGDGPVQVGVNYDHGWCLTWLCAEEFEAVHGKPAKSESVRREAITRHIFGCDTMMGGRCEQLDLADGSRLLVFPAEPEHDGLIVSVQLVRKDGTRVAVFETSAIPDYTSGNGKSVPAARDDLPLTVDKLIAIATSPLWTDRVARSISTAGETLTSFNLLDGIEGGD